MEEQKNSSVFAAFEANKVTYEEATKKYDEESSSFSKTNYFSMKQDGTYRVRILPIAPVQQPDKTWKSDRVGYEYPVKSMLMKLINPTTNKPMYISVCKAQYAGIDTDIIDEYVKLAKEKYASNENLIKSIQGEGRMDDNLKWSNQRVMYVYDVDNMKSGIQLLQLSFSQYRDLEAAKLNVWDKLQKKAKGENVPCPISSINGAYPVEIIKKKDGSKTKYTLSVDTLSDVMELDEKQVNDLLSASRIPEVVYRYSRYAFEAVIEFLNQYDKKMGVSVMSTEEMKNTIEKVNLQLSKDDTSHFSFDKKKENNASDTHTEETIDTLWDKYDELCEKGLDDKTEEGGKLRDIIREFIDKNELNVSVRHSKKTEDILRDIEDEMSKGDSKDEEDSDVSDDSDNDEEKNEDVREESTKDEEEESEEEEAPKNEEPKEEVEERSHRHAPRTARAPRRA